MRTFLRGAVLAVALASAAGGCAFEDGPARQLVVTLRSPAERTVTTDLQWQVTLREARLFVHKVTFLAGEAESSNEGHSNSRASLTHTIHGEPPAIGAVRLAHSEAGGEAPAAEGRVGELIVGRAVDLLATPLALGNALFARGSTATEARILVAPPEASEPTMRGGGLYVAGTATPPSGGEAISFEAALPASGEASVAGLAIDADEELALEIHVHWKRWFDGIDFAALPAGRIEDGSEAGDALEEALLKEGFQIDVVAR